MRFNSIITTFLLFFSCIKNASPVHPIAQMLGCPFNTWPEIPFINRDGFQVARATAMHLHAPPGKTPGHVLIEGFSITSPTSHLKHKREIERWDKVGRLIGCGHNSDRGFDYIVLNNHIPDEKNWDLLQQAVLRHLDQRFKVHHTFHEDERRKIYAYAIANLQEFSWVTKFAGQSYIAKAIFELEDMLSEAHMDVRLSLVHRPNSHTLSDWHNAHDSGIVYDSWIAAAALYVECLH